MKKASSLKTHQDGGTTKKSNSRKAHQTGGNTNRRKNYQAGGTQNRQRANHRADGTYSKVQARTQTNTNSRNKIVGIKLDGDLDEDFEVFFDEDSNFYSVMFGSSDWVDYMCDLKKYLEIENFYVHVFVEDFDAKYDKITHNEIVDGYWHYKKLKEIRENVKKAKSKPKSKYVVKIQPQDSGDNVFDFNSSVPLPPSSPSVVQMVEVSIPSLDVPLKIVSENIDIPITKEVKHSYPSLDVPLQIVLENSDFSIHDEPSIIDEDMIDDVIVVVYDDITCVKVDVIDATQDRVCKSVDVDIYKNEIIPQIEVDTDESFLKVDVLEKVKHTQVGVVHKIVEVDIIVNDKHTQDGVVHDVEAPSQFRVDDYFIYNDGEQEVLSVIEQCTHQTPINVSDNIINKEIVINKEVQANFYDTFNKDRDNEKQINKEKNFIQNCMQQNY